MWKYIPLVLAIVVLLGAVAVLLILVVTLMPGLDPQSRGTIIGVAIGALAGMIGSAATAFIGLWNVAKENSERLKDRVSAHAVELTKLDYELRLKSMERFGYGYDLYVPIKQYREFYRAMLALHDKDDWPDTLNKMGLLNMIPMGPEKPKDVSDNQGKARTAKNKRAAKTKK